MNARSWTLPSFRCRLLARNRNKCSTAQCSAFEEAADYARVRAIHGQAPVPWGDINRNPQAMAACSNRPDRRILPPWAPSHERRSTAARSGRRLNARPKRASKPTALPAKPGTNACSVSKGQPNPRRHWAMRSMRDTGIWKSAASVATPTRPSRSISSGDRRQRRSMSWSVTCAARTARRSGAIRTSAAIWLRCARRRYRRAIRRRIGGRGNGDSQPRNQDRQRLFDSLLSLLLPHGYADRTWTSHLSLRIAKVLFGGFSRVQYCFRPAVAVGCPFDLGAF
jgi:hypothetical protein